MNREELGKIAKVTLGSGGYQEAMFGFSFELKGEAWACGDFWGAWTNWSEDCSWTMEDQTNTFVDSFYKVKHLMKEAKVDDFNDLIGKPVKVIFEGNRLSSWRILTEVL